MSGGVLVFLEISQLTLFEVPGHHGRSISKPSDQQVRLPRTGKLRIFLEHRMLGTQLGGFAWSLRLPKVRRFQRLLRREGSSDLIRFALEIDRGTPPELEAELVLRRSMAPRRSDPRRCPARAAPCEVLEARSTG